MTFIQRRLDDTDFMLLVLDGEVIESIVVSRTSRSRGRDSAGANEA